METARAGPEDTPPKAFIGKALRKEFKAHPLANREPTVIFFPSFPKSATGQRFPQS
jgi:hypothetical protein